MLSPDRIPNRIELLPRGSITGALRTRTLECERRFGIRFCAIAHLPAPLLGLLHALEQDGNGAHHSYRQQVVESGIEDFGLVSAIANKPTLTAADRRGYLNSLLAAYRRMPLPDDGADDAAIVAPRREGMLLARELRLLRGRFFTPHLKRIPLADDLAVGIEFIPSLPKRSRVCRIIDGAVASGATVITLMEALSPSFSEFDVYTVHCTPASVSAITRYAATLRRRVTLHAASICGTLNHKFYALSSISSSALVIGDVGDIIAPLFGKLVD